jgi:hypothetical protein
LLVLWPHYEIETYATWLSGLAPNRQILVCEGALERGDLEETAYPLYLTMQASRAEAPPALARFEGGLELVDYQLAIVHDAHLHVTLRWRATPPVAGDYVAFVQLLQDGQLVAQGQDAPPGTRYLPTSQWRPGDVFVNEHDLELYGAYEGRQAGQQLIAGLYDWPSQNRLSVLDKNGQTQGDYALLDPSVD